ncbi:unnamed protein product, partial [marine sediment metagenome]
SFFHALALNPDGSAWVNTADKLVRFSPTGQEIAEISLDEEIQGVRDMAVLPFDGSIYGVGGTAAFRMTDDGVIMWVRDGFVIPKYVVVDPGNGSAWIMDLGSPIGDRHYSPGSTIIHLAADGTELWRGDTFNFDYPPNFELDPRDGTLWLWDELNGQLVHLGVVDDQRPPFADVPTLFWAYDEIGACFSQGIVGGYDDGRYHPDYAVSRDQIAVFISRALVGDNNVPDGPSEATFDDVPTDFWAYKYIEYCVANGIVQGYDLVTYAPTVTVARDAMAVFISRAVAGGDGNVPVGPAEATFDDVPTDYWAY